MKSLKNASLKLPNYHGIYTKTTAQEGEVLNLLYPAVQRCGLQTAHKF